jgi:hypothetical protein
MSYGDEPRAQRSSDPALCTGGNLHLYSVNCVGVINSGDSVNFTTTYTLTPKQVITSP